MILLLAAWLAIAQAGQADSLSLSDAVGMARHRRAVLEGASARVAEARGDARIAGEVPNPTASASHTQSAPEYHLSVQQPFDWLLTRRPGLQAANALVERARVDSALVDALLVADVRRAFFGLLAAQRSETIALEETAIADSVVRIAAARLARGDIAEMELTQLQLEAGRARQLLSRTREGRRVASSVFGRVVGLSVAAAPRLAGDLADGLGSEPSDVPSMERIPVVRLALADSAAAAGQLATARRARIPLPGLEVGHEWRDPTLPGQSFWLFGVTIPIPLLNQGGGRVAVSGARADQANAAIVETRLEVTQQVTEARVRLEEAAARAVRARDSLIPAARRLRARALLAYQLGETGLLAVLEALRSEREAESAGLEDLLVFQEARATWYALLGIAR